MKVIHTFINIIFSLYKRLFIYLCAIMTDNNKINYYQCKYSIYNSIYPNVFAYFFIYKHVNLL